MLSMERESRKCKSRLLGLYLSDSAFDGHPRKAESITPQMYVKFQKPAGISFLALVVIISAFISPPIAQIPGVFNFPAEAAVPMVATAGCPGGVQAISLPATAWGIRWAPQSGLFGLGWE